MLIASGLKLAELVTSCRAYLSPQTPTHRQLASARKQGQRWRAVRKWQRSSAGGHHYSGAKKVRRRSLGRALSWPRVLGLQRLDSVIVSIFVFLHLIWQIVQSGAFCNDTQSRPRIIRKHDQSKISPKDAQLTQGTWPANTTSQSVSLFAIDQGQRLSESTSKTTNKVTINISWFWPPNHCFQWGFDGFWSFNHIHKMLFSPYTIAFNGFSMVFGSLNHWLQQSCTIGGGTTRCFDGSFTSNFHWHCFWTFLNELL